MNHRQLPFTTVQQINKRRANRELVLFGAGYIAGKMLRKLSTSPDFFVDNSANMWGADVESIEVKSPSALVACSEKPFVVICSTSFVEISEQLNELGFESDIDFVVSPILNDLRIINELESTERKLLVASGGQVSVDDEFGGGLYEVTINGLGYDYKKVFDGSCHSILEVDARLFVSDDEQGIIELDEQYNIIHKIQFPVASRGHGLAYHEQSKTIFVACSGLDQVLRYDLDGELVGEFSFSVKQKSNDAVHHTNDCLIVGDSLYVSMFSETGNWKKDIFDGAVIEFDILSGQKVGKVISNLWMPHNIQFIDGSLTVLDSLRGGLVRNNAQTVGQFPAFTRGLAYDGQYFYIGQSRNRNFTKNLGVSLNISIDTGIVIFDEHTKVSRTIPLPSKISEVHGIHILS